jgi:hypothetical protein
MNTDLNVCAGENAVISVATGLSQSIKANSGTVSKNIPNHFLLCPSQC